MRFEDLPEPVQDGIVARIGVVKDSYVWKTNENYFIVAQSKDDNLVYCVKVFAKDESAAFLEYVFQEAI